MSGCYFWIDGAVAYVHGWCTLQEQKTVYNVPCVDANEDNPHMRYGIFTRNWRAGRWESRDLATFPKEFRMHLLLLGVT